MKRLTPFALLLTITIATPAIAQPDAEAGTAELAAGLTQLNATLLEMKELLSMQVETQGLDLLLKRSELVSTQAARLENLMRSAESTRMSLEDQVLQMESEQEVMEEAIRSGAMGVGDDQVEVQFHIRRIETRLEQTRDRLRAAEGEVVGLQSRLDQKERDLEDWQELIDRRLSNI
jgi:chromosome segregation ATPase